VPDVVASLRSLAALPAVAESVEAAQDACTQLRWHQALRRRVPEAAAESRVRGAWASAELDGARVPVQLVRDAMRGARSWPEDLDPVERVLRGAVAATAETEHVRLLVTTAPLQAMARLHVAAAAHLLARDQLGRPRVAGEGAAEFAGLGPAPAPDEVTARLDGLVRILLDPAEVPTVIVAGIVHAEIALVRPFVRGNGLVGRAMERAMMQACGLEPTGVAVPEVGHASQGGPAYLGALTAYATGSRQGVALWLTHSAEAVRRGATEGMRIADAVLAGRIDHPPHGSGDDAPNAC
jgi:Fic family protein